MQKPTITRKCVFIGTVLLLIANLSWWAFTPRERIYRGQSVSSWIQQLSISRFGQTNGVLETLLDIGPDCLPALAAELETQDNFFTETWQKLWPKLPTGWRRRLPQPSSRAIRRATAAWALGQIGPAARPVTPALVAGLDDPDDQVRVEAAEALRYVGLKTPEIIAAIGRRLSDKAPNVQSRAASALWAMTPESHTSLPALIQLLHVPDQAYNAVLPMQELGSLASNAIPALIEVVRHGAAAHPSNWKFPQVTGVDGKPDGKDHSAHNRAMAAKALGKIGVASSGVLEALQAALKYPPTLEGVPERRKPWVRQNAAQALGNLGTNAITAIPGLVQALDEKDPLCLQEIVLALGAMGIHARPALPKLKSILGELPEPFATQAAIGEDRKWELFWLRGAVARAISQIDVTDKSSLAVLFEHSDGDYPTRQYLAGMGPKINEFVPQLIQKLASTNGQPQAATAELLWHIDRNNPAIVPALVQAIQHTNRAVRAYAAYWYWKVTGDADSAIRVLVAGLEEPPSNASQVYPQWLGDMGGAARPAVPALKKALWHHNIFTRRNAAKALEKIDPSELDFLTPRE